MQMLTQFADSSSGIGALGFNGKDFLIQLITFGLAYLVLRRYAFGPILKALKQRRETIESSVKLAEQLQKEQADLTTKVEAMLHETRLQADGILADAQSAARQTISDTEAKARDKAANILKEAESRVDQETARVRHQLEKELVGLVADATEAIIDEKVDAKKDAQLIERALKGRQTA